MIKHYEDKENKRVFAIADDCELDAVKKIVKRHPFIPDMDHAWKYTQNEDTKEITSKLDFGLDKALMPKTFVAVAKCADGDTYDYQTGMDLADKKLLAKIAASEKKAIARWKKHQTKILDAVDLSYQKN